MASTINLHDPHSIYRWAQEKRSEIERAFLMKGGWEGWLQVELGLRLARDGHTTVEREQHVFKNKSQAVDMVITTLGAQPPIRTIVEFKCESLGQDCRLDAEGRRPVAVYAQGTTKPHFAGRIEEDLAKLGTQGANLRDEYAGCWYLCIGFSLSPQARDYLLEKGQAQTPERYFEAVSPSELNRRAKKWGFRRSKGVASQAPHDDTLVMWCYLGQRL